MEDMDKVMSVNPKKPDKPADAKAAAPKPDAAKPQEQPKDESGKFVAKQPEKLDGPAQLRKRLAEVESDLTKTRAEKESTVKELQTKMADLEKRPFLTKEQQARYDALEKRSKELEAQLYARNYAESPEYKEKFQKRWQNKYAENVAEVRRLQIKSKDPETGEEKFRPATDADFELVRSVRGSRIARLEMAESLFGNRANIVADYANELDAIEREAGQEVEQRRAKFDEEMAQRGNQMQEFSTKASQSAQQTEAQLAEKYPTWFGKSEDADEQTAMEKGLAFVDGTSSEADKMTPEERGSKLAVLRMWAAAFPRNVHRIQKQEAEIAELKAQIAKLQGSDPGATGEHGSVEKTTDEPKGTAGLLKDF